MSAIISKDFIISNPKPELPVPNISVGEFLYETLKSYPKDKKLFVDQETKQVLTAGDLLEHGRRLAAVLLKRIPNLSKKDVAIFHAVNSLEHIVCHLTMCFLGITVSPVTINCKAFELERQIKDSSGSLIFCSSGYAPTVEEVVQKHEDQIKLVTLLDGQYGNMVTYSELIKESETVDPIGQVPHFPITDPKEEIYLIVYTSGSTGLPKGAAHTHYAFIYAQMNASRFNCTPYCTEPDTPEKLAAMAGKMNFYSFYPLAHSSGQMTLLMCYIIGVQSVVNSHQTNESILQAIQEYKIMTLSVNPALGQYMATNPEADKYDLSSLKVISTGGCHFPESIARQLMAKYKVIVFEAYGLTEIGFVSVRGPTDPYESHNIGCVGRGISMKLVDLDTLQALPPHKEGEIWLKTDGLIKCYINRPDATAEAITSDGWYRSGDIGYYNEKGQVVLCDRIKEMIKYTSYAVYPAEVEHILSLHPAVLESVVVPLPHPVDNEHPLAYVKLRKGKSATAEELMAYVKDKLADQKQIRGGVIFWDGEIPRVSIGKPDRQHFKLLAKQLAASQSQVQNGVHKVQNGMNGKVNGAHPMVTDNNGNIVA